MKARKTSPSKDEEGYQSINDALIEFLAGRESVRVVLEHVDFQTRLVRICRSIAKNKDDAADLVQNTWVKLLKYEQTILHNKPKDADQFFSWLYKVARSIYIDSSKKERLPLDDTPIEELHLGVKGRNPEDERLLTEFERFIQTLPSEHQRALELKWEGYSYRGIAEILGVEGHDCSHVAVRTWISNAWRDFIKGARVKKASGF